MQSELALGTCLHSKSVPCRSHKPEREVCVSETWQGWRAGKKTESNFTCPMWVSSCSGSLWHWDPWVPLCRGIPHRDTFLKKMGQNQQSQWLKQKAMNQPFLLLFASSCDNTMTRGNYFELAPSSHWWGRALNSFITGNTSVQSPRENFITLSI